MVVTDVEELKINFHAVLTSGGGCLTERQFIRECSKPSYLQNVDFVVVVYIDCGY